jgi:hypothetical protein
VYASRDRSLRFGALAQRRAVRAGRDPQAAVVARRVFERPPEADNGRRIADQKARVLMPHHLAADARLLEDQHRLHQPRLREAEVGRDRGQPRVAREAAEHRLAIVQRVADLVDGARLVHAQRALRIERLLFEEATHRARGFDERTLAQLRAVARRKHRGVAVVGLERGDDLVRAPRQRRDLCARREAGQHEHAVALPHSTLFVIQESEGWGWHERCENDALRCWIGARLRRMMHRSPHAHQLEETCTD